MHEFWAFGLGSQTFPGLCGVTFVTFIWPQPLGKPPSPQHRQAFPVTASSWTTQSSGLAKGTFGDSLRSLSAKPWVDLWKESALGSCKQCRDEHERKFRHLFETLLLILLAKYPLVRFLDYKVTSYNFLRNHHSVFYHFTFSPTMFEGSSVFTALSTLVFFAFLFITGTRGFDPHFPDD